MKANAKKVRILCLEDDSDWQRKIKGYLDVAGEPPHDDFQDDLEQGQINVYVGDRFELTIVDSRANAERLVSRSGSQEGVLEEKGPFDLFIVDISLALGDSGDEQGLAFVEEIRNREAIYRQAGESIPGLKILIFTGYPWRDRIKRAFRDLGVVDFLDKGRISRTEFAKAIEAALND